MISRAFDSTLCHRIISRVRPRTRIRTQRRSRVLQHRARVRSEGSMAYIIQGEHTLLEAAGGMLCAERVGHGRAWNSFHLSRRSRLVHIL